MFSMKIVHHSPTVTFSDIIGIYDAIDYYRKTYKLFHIVAYLPNGNKKKVTCNFLGLISFLQKIDADSFYVFVDSHHLDISSKLLIFEKDEFGFKFY